MVNRRKARINRKNLAAWIRFSNFHLSFNPKRMKSLIQFCCALALVLGISTSTQAQNVDPAMIAQRQLDRMERELGLSKDQGKKLWPIVEETITTMMEMRQSGKSQEEMMAEMRKVGEAQMEKFKAILTPEQMEKYKEMQQRMRQGGGPGGGGGFGGGAPRN